MPISTDDAGPPMTIGQVLVALEEMPPRDVYRSWLPRAPRPNSAALFVMRGEPEIDPPYIVIIADTNNARRKPEIRGGPMPDQASLRRMMQDAQRMFGRLRFERIPEGGDMPGFEEMLAWARDLHQRRRG